MLTLIITTEETVRSITEAYECSTGGCIRVIEIEVAEKIEKKTGIPVLNAGRTSLKFAESLLSMDLSHSKITYPFPQKLAKTQKEKKKRAKEV